MITEATIQHYKSIADATLRLGPQNIIVGANGVGKSNLVDAISFVSDLATEDLDTAIVKRHGIESVRQWSKTRPYHISIELKIKSEGGQGSYRITLASARGTYRVIEEAGEWLGRPVIFNSRGDENAMRRVGFFRDSDGRIKYYSEDEEEQKRFEDYTELPASDSVLTLLGGPAFSMASYALQPIAESLQSYVPYSIYPNTLREPRVVSRRERLSHDGSNLASILKLLNSGHRRSKNALIDSLRVIVPNIVDINVRSAGGYYVPVLFVKEDSGDVHQFNMSQLSDGTLRILGILTAFYQPNAPEIIALEEPEQMIHPGALPVISDAANDFTSNNESLGQRQVFITTHSPTYLDLVSPESIIWTNFDNGITTCGPISMRQLSLIKDQLFSPGEIMLAEGFLDE